MVESVPAGPESGALTWGSRIMSLLLASASLAMWAGKEQWIIDNYRLQSAGSMEEFNWDEGKNCETAAFVQIGLGIRSMSGSLFFG
jgi:hypothetical protein